MLNSILPPFFTGVLLTGFGIPAYAADPILPDNLINIPLVRQATDYTCGVAALQSILRFYGEDFREDVLARRLHANHKDGTRTKEIASFARTRGYSVEAKEQLSLADLKRLLDLHRPVIVLIQAWPEKSVDFKTDWKDGHYVVAVGYDESNVFFMDPSTLGSFTYIPAQEFIERWHDIDGKEKLNHFGMVIWKQNQSFESERPVKLN